MTIAPKMFGLSYILGHTTNKSMQQKILRIAEDNNISGDDAWIQVVMTLIDEMQNEDSPASLSSILTLMMERPVKAPRLFLLPHKMKTDGIERTHPMINFQMRNVIDEDKNDFIEIDKNLADRIGHVLQMTFECDFIETVFVQ